MIKPTELRIGNLINNQIENIKVDGIGFDNVDEAWCVYWSNNNASEFLKDCNPIPLTEDWLLKFGFEYKETDKSDNYVLHLFRFTYVKEGRFKNKRYLNLANISYEDFSCCKYVHQLQNLYFALTGEELVSQNQ